MIKSISLNEITGEALKITKAEANTAWEKFGAVVNAKYSNNAPVVNMVKPVYLKHNVLRFAHAQW